MAEFAGAKRVIKFLITYKGKKEEEYEIDGVVKDKDDYLSNLIHQHVEMQGDVIKDLKIKRTIITDYKAD